MANATIAVEGLEARAFLLLPPPEAAWFSWFFDERVAIAGGGATTALSSGDLLADLGVLGATGNALFVLNGQTTQSAFGSLQTAANANQQIFGVEALTSFEPINATGVAFVALTGQQSEGSLTEPVALGDGLTQVAGLEAQTKLGEVQAGSSINATTTVAGLTLNAQLGQVTAQTVSPETIVGGSWHKRYPTSIEKSAVAKISGLASIIEAGNIRALGEIQVSAVANLQPLRVVTELQPTQANGVLGLSDEEILVLLAA